MFEVQAIGSPIGATALEQCHAVAPEVGACTFFAGSRALTAEIEWPTGTTCTGLRLTRLWTGRKRRVVCEHAFHLATPSGTVELPLQSVIGAAPRGREIHRRAILSNSAILGLYLADGLGDAVWCSPDRDPDLPCAAVFFNPQGLHNLLLRTAAAPRWGVTEGCEEASGAWDVRLSSYRVGRRCVARVRRRSDDGAQGLYLKMFRRLPTPRHVDRLRHLGQLLPARSGGVVRMPEILDYLPEERLLITVDARPASTASHYDSAARAQAAHVLAVLHGVTCEPDERTHTPLDELETVARWAHVLPLVRPDADVPRLQALHAQLERSLAPSDEQGMTLIHRDFYHTQLLWSHGEAWLVDLDTLCRGHRELDIATYSAHAMLDAALNERLGTTMRDGLGDFLERYRSYGGVVEMYRLAWYLGCALARLGSLQLARGADRSVITPLWDAAEALAADPRAAIAARMAKSPPRAAGEGSV